MYHCLTMPQCPGAHKFKFPFTKYLPTIVSLILCPGMRFLGLISMLPVWIRAFPRVSKEPTLERFQVSVGILLYLRSFWLLGIPHSLCLFPRILSAICLLEGDIQIKQSIKRQCINQSSHFYVPQVPRVGGGNTSMIQKCSVSPERGDIRATLKRGTTRIKGFVNSFMQPQMTWMGFSIGATEKEHGVV